MEEITEEQMKQYYNNYIKGLIQSFKIVEQIAFREKIAAFVKTGQGVKSEEEHREWNNRFFAIVIDHSTLSEEEIEENLGEELKHLITKLKEVEEAKEN